MTHLSLWNFPLSFDNYPLPEIYFVSHYYSQLSFLMIRICIVYVFIFLLLWTYMCLCLKCDSNKCIEVGLACFSRLTVWRNTLVGLYSSRTLCVVVWFSLELVYYSVLFALSPAFFHSLSNFHCIISYHILAFYLYLFIFNAWTKI